MARELHRKVHPVCPWGATTWGECDKAADDAKAEWDAMQQVLLAYKVAQRGELAIRPYRKLDDQFAQLVLVIAGERQAITNKDGNPAQGTWVERLRAAIARVIAGDLPSYNLYRLPGQSGQ